MAIIRVEKRLPYYYGFIVNSTLSSSAIAMTCDWFGLCSNCLLCVGNSLGLGDVSVVEVFGLDLPLGLQSLDDVLVLPAHVVAQPSQGAELE